MRIEDPWYDAVATGGAELGCARATAPSHLPAARVTASPRQQRPVRRPAAHEVYQAVQHSAAFQQVRRRYRRFALPVGAAFLLCYLGYLVLAVSAPGLMARPVIGVLNVGMAAFLVQFAATFLLTWLYARHARLRRDHSALELRWETQEMTRAAASAAPGEGAR
ncbi:DUF485 domain-containing protein [Streptomyces smyrnaeus]|uniref:DUF485 domain-containing protein n=1 Tax=Streptomyces smyrnaeus TaxID=1387713 RepID=A0ABS3Y0Y7_9ACTN|nr:DUF485 domain-containing protein [Streptomyces smyrnaeus]MBO8201256.1 DUF485 domain-containing protein [Streptomyces smyrnaeus]